MVSLAGQICEVCCPFLMHVCRNCANHRVCASAIYGRAIEASWPTQTNRVTGEGVCEHCHMEFLAFLILQCVLDENSMTEHAPCIIAAAQSVRNPERRNRIFRNIYEANILHPVVEILLIARWIPPQSIVDEMVVHDDTQWWYMSMMCVSGVKFTARQTRHVLARDWPNVETLLALSAAPLSVEDYDTLTVETLPPRTMLNLLDPTYDHVFSARVFQQILLERLLDGSQNITQTTPDRLQNTILILYEKSGTMFEEEHLRMVTERGLFGIGLILIDTFSVLYPPAIYRTLDIEEYTYWHFVNESHRVAAVDTYKRIIRNIRRSHFKRTLRTFVKYRRSILAWYETTLTRLYHPSLHLIIVPLQSSNPLDNLQMVHLPGGSLFQETAQRFRAMCTDNREDAEVYAISEEDLDRLRHRAVDRANGPFRQRDEN